MGFYIELEKISESESSVRYKFFLPVYEGEVLEENIGIIELYKDREEIEEIKHAANDTRGYIFEGAARALVTKCWQKGVCLDKTE